MASFRDKMAQLSVSTKSIGTVTLFFLTRRIQVWSIAVVVEGAGGRDWLSDIMSLAHGAL